MKKLVLLFLLLLLVGGISVGTYFYGDKFAASVENEEEGDDPDMPSSLQTRMTKEEFMVKRANFIAELRGIEEGKPFDPQLRVNAVRQLENQEKMVAKMSSGSSQNALAAGWTEIGPNPIPNAQVQTGTSTAASGRTTSIAIHPTNPNIVYAGTAQGGLYRTTDGGATWTPMLDNALSLAVGAVTIAPSQPDTVYVGTGEAGFSADSYFGVGIYRIDNASTANPILTGPLNKDASNNDVFTGRSIGRIIVDPTNADTIFAVSTSGVGGIVSASNSVLPNRGLFRSTNATSASPTFTKLGVVSVGENISIVEAGSDPTDANRLVLSYVDTLGGLGGVYTSTNALAATPTFTRTLALTGTSSSSLRTEFAAQRSAGATDATFYAASGDTTTGTNGGKLFRSTDGGLTWTQRIANSFCGGQCFYDIALAVDPTNPDRVFLGGTTTVTAAISVDGGATFIASQSGLHTDSHVFAVAPSDPTIVYFGSDGGIYKSTTSGLTWTSASNTTYRATQFVSIAVHPTDPNFTIGGTQDNGTNLYRANGTWFRNDAGDGGYAVIDQDATDTTTVRMYHTYYNATNQQLYVYRNTPESGTWATRGCTGTATTNGITCSASTAVLFYAPLEQGPTVTGGTGNTIYYATDRLYRSINTGINNATVSQAPIETGVPISAVGISRQNDNVRIVGLRSGGIWGTSTGSTTLTNLDPNNNVPNNAIARAIIDPNDQTTAYVSLSIFGVTNVWKATNINTGTPTWTAAAGSGATGLPLVPVNSLIVDQSDSNRLYAGTDIGVYTSADKGANWLPFGTGLPRIAVFGMKITSGKLLRIATHGRGMWEIAALAPTAANVSVAGRILTGSGRGINNVAVKLTDATGKTRTTVSSAFGYYRFADVPAGQTYIIGAQAKSYTFGQPQQVLNVTSDNNDVNFIANGK